MRVRGFTLIELLVALFITALLFAMGYAALQQGLTSRREVEEQSARLLAVQQALRIVEQDFELLQPRPVRDILGDNILPAFTAVATTGISSFGSSASAVSLNGSAVPLVSFTRGGWTNMAGIQRSELQRVSYTVEKGVLMRSYLPVLDATESDTPVRRALIDHVKSFTMRFMDAGHNWQNQWPVNTTINAGANLNTNYWRPVAVEVVLELDDFGILLRHIEVAG